MTNRVLRREKARGQSLAEMALALPIILLLVFGIFELGRIVIIFSSVSHASREAARFGAAIGTVGGLPRYLACDAIRQHAQDTSPFAGLTDDDIKIAYDESDQIAGAMVRYGECGAVSADDVELGDRIVVTVTGQINSIVPFLPDFSPTFVTARTILKNIAIGPVECNDGVDNDGDGFIDWAEDEDERDPGCDSLDDNTEAFCYRLSLFTSPPGAGSLSIYPGSNCSNRYIERSGVNLEAFEDNRTEVITDTDILHTFDYWTGITITPTETSTNPITVTMDADKHVVAHFRLLTSDLVITKTSSPAMVSAGDPYSYTIDIGNPYTDTARNIVMTDTLPLDINYTGVLSNTGGTGTAECSDLLPDSTIVCTLSELGVGQTATFSLAVTAPVISELSVTRTNTVTVTALEFDPDRTNNTSTAVTTVALSDLSMIEKTDSDDPVDPLEEYNYVITVKNSGPLTATDVVITDILDGLLTYISSPDCVYISPTVICSIGDLAAGETRMVSFRVQAPNTDVEIVIENLATVSGNEIEYDSSDNSSEVETTTVEPPP